MYHTEDLFDMRSVVGGRLENILSERAYTKAKFCQISGISRPTLDKLLSGNLTSKTNYEKHISKVLHSLSLTPDALMGNVRNGYNQSKALRNALHIKPKEIAESTDISFFRLQEIEAGEDASIAELRNIAYALSTSVRSVLGTHYFQTQIALPSDVICSYREDTEKMSGFWGHVGILPSSSKEYLWFPITGNTRHLIQRMLEKDRMVVPCMNNKLLLINTKNINKLVLLDDACDAPSFGNWDSNVNCGDIPLVIYDTLDDYMYYKDAGQLPPADVISPSLLKIMDSLIESGAVTTDEASETISIYYNEGNVVQTYIDFESGETITEEISSIYEFDIPAPNGKFLFYQDYNGAEIFFNSDNIALIELPLLKTEDVICKAQEELLSEISTDSSPV